jgi:hypothetical protein
MNDIIKYCLGVFACIFAFLGGITFVVTELIYTILLLLVSLVLLLFLFKMSNVEIEDEEKRDVR